MSEQGKRKQEPKGASTATSMPGVEPVDETVLIPVAAPRYDEEHASPYEAQYEQDFSRFDHAWQDNGRNQEIPIPHMGDEDGGGHRVPGEGRSRSRWRPFVALIFVGVMATCIFAAATYGLELWGGKHVPNVVGISEARARALLEEAGFVPEVKARTADDGIGFVLEQDPINGVRAAEGSSVTIVVAVSRTMPDLVGLTQNEAKDLLAKAGATSVRVVEEASAEEEGRVLRVSPAAGEPFSAHQQVTLTVARKAEVPDVMGKDRTEAQALLADAGFKMEAKTVVRVDAKPNTAVSSDPEAGAKLDPGSTVRVYFAEVMPADPLHLAEYFGKSSQGLAEYLSEQSFWLAASHATGDNYAEAAYGSDHGYLLFTDYPYSHSKAFDNDTGQDVLADGLPFSGLRYEVAAGAMPAGASDLSEAASKELMNRCGLSNVTDVCTQVDVQMPKDAKKTGVKFRCTYGETGGYSWTVMLLSEGDGTRAVVTCAPTSYYREWFDLSPYGNSICDMIAYAEAYAQ